MIWRVRGRSEFADLARARRTVRAPLDVRVVCRDSSEPPRVAYAIGKRLGGAVERNRLRRRLRAAVQESAELLTQGCAYLIGARPEAHVLTPIELRTTVRDLLSAAPTRVVS